MVTPVFLSPPLWRKAKAQDDPSGSHELPWLVGSRSLSRGNGRQQSLLALPEDP